ncbi:MAG: hypothetical protein ABFE07_28485 [Armatimonadia bacterium]
MKRKRKRRPRCCCCGHLEGHKRDCVRNNEWTCGCPCHRQEWKP